MSGRAYGLLLPHFGAHASVDAIIEGSRLAERLGFDSLWVRDHIVFHPHGMEGSDRTHLEPLVVLGAVAAATDRISLGTGSLIPHRHPIHLAGALASLSYMARRTVIAGFGLGSFDHEFAAIGLGDAERDELLEEQIGILRRLWTGESTSHEGRYYQFADIDIHPSPASPIPIWYCGNSAAAARRAAEYCDGFMPGRITLKTMDKRMRRLHRLATERGRPAPTGAAIPLVSPAHTSGEAIAKVPLDALMADANRHGRWEPPASGRFERYEDLEGALVAGTPDHIAQVVERYHAIGVEHVVFDLRFRFDEWLECVTLLGEEVLPLLRSDAARQGQAV